MDLHFLDICEVLELIDAEEIEDIVEYGVLVRIKSGIILFDNKNTGSEFIDKIEKLYLSQKTYKYLLDLAKRETDNAERLFNLGHYEGSVLSSRLAVEVMSVILITKLGHYFRSVKRIPMLMKSDERLETFSEYFFSINGLSSLESDYVENIVELAQKSLVYIEGFFSTLESDPK